MSACPRIFIIYDKTGFVKRFSCFFIERQLCYRNHRNKSNGARSRSCGGWSGSGTEPLSARLRGEHSSPCGRKFRGRSARRRSSCGSLRMGERRPTPRLHSSRPILSRIFTRSHWIPQRSAGGKAGCSIMRCCSCAGATRGLPTAPITCISRFRRTARSDSAC